MLIRLCSSAFIATCLLAGIPTQAQVRVRGTINLDSRTLSALCSGLPKLGDTLKLVNINLPRNIGTWDEKALLIGNQFKDAGNRLANIKNTYPQIANAFTSCLEGQRNFSTLKAIPEVIDDLANSDLDLSVVVNGCANLVRQQQAGQAIGNCLAQPGVFDVQGVENAANNAAQLAENLGPNMGNSMKTLFGQTEGSVRSCFANTFKAGSLTSPNYNALASSSLIEFQQCMMNGVFSIETFDKFLTSMDELDQILDDPTTPRQLRDSMLSCGSSAMGTLLEMVFPLQELALIAQDIGAIYTDLKAAGGALDQAAKRNNARKGSISNFVEADGKKLSLLERHCRARR